MTRPGTTNPDLVSELRAIQERVSALERKPVPQSIFDQYPTVEWAAVGRPKVSGNSWSSCGVANVTGLKYDRVEVKYITDLILTGRSEAEIRLAAFRHDHDSQTKECITATEVVRLVGNSTRAIGVGKWRWMHGIEFGWNYNETDSAIYTVELQHRNPNDCPQVSDPTPKGTDVLTFVKTGGASADPDLGIWSPFDAANDSSNGYSIIAERRPNSGGWNAPSGWTNIQNPFTAINLWDGAYHVSNMQYCVGLSQAILPEATPGGWHWYNGGTSKFVRGADITEPYFSV